MDSFFTQHYKIQADSTLRGQVLNNKPKCKRWGMVSKFCWTIKR